MQTVSGASQQNPNDPRISIDEAERLFGAGRFREAVERYQQALRLAPSHPELHYKIGFAAWNSAERELAGRHFAEAARLAPHHPAAHQALADWSRNMGDAAAALLHSERAMAIAPNEPDILASRAWALGAAGHAAEAWRLIERLSTAGRAYPKLAALCAQIAPVLGNQDAVLALLESILRSPSLAGTERQQVHFAVAQILDQLSRYDEAFGHASVAHHAARRPYDPDLIRRLVDRRIEYYTPRKLHDLPRASHGSRRPVFILGMPRSGTTLVEQILSSHRQVFGAGELPLIRELAVSVADADPVPSFDFPCCLDALPLRGCDQLAAKYLSAIRSFDAGSRYVTDKMPQNFLFMGIIVMLFPECHVIHCVREPMDTCLSCYMTDFNTGHEFAQDPAHLGSYYVHYRRLMSHWRNVLNYPMIEVSYEQIVSGLEGQTRRLLDCLDLPWDPNCLEFHRNPRHVHTASMHQVRRPIYRSSIGRWKHYAKHLTNLAAALSPLDSTSPLPDSAFAVAAR